jgi:membrane protein DedA with SNARE-associated domain
VAYWVVFFGAMIEGETIILSASAIAATGYLSITKIWTIAFLSTLFVDQTLFYFGLFIRKKPRRSFRERFPMLRNKLTRATELFQKHDILFILMFRFIYGIRSISPIVIGLCGSAPRRFIPLNFIAALIWSIISCGVGYCLGDFLFDSETGIINSKNMHQIQYIIGAAILLFIAIVCFVSIKKHIKNKRTRSTDNKN